MIFIQNVNIFYLIIEKKIFYCFVIVFNRTLEKDIVGDTSGYLKKILLALLHGERPESKGVNLDDAENDART